ncbi:hypothetical protein [Nakamurella endophytica]|uniref:hypothetical protein n=1 Tax=Nakamurella endophytica TaxID=1748367 RepID=UPI00166A231B|nr:hypothetical protein [Nakamurella endophytica]
MPDTVRGRRPPDIGRTLLTSVPAFALLIGFAVLHHAFSLLIMWALMFAVLVLPRLRPVTVVDQQGVYRPWRWRRRVGWEQVDYVAPPAPGVASPRLVLRNDSTVPLDDIPPDVAWQVAAIGGKPYHPHRVPMPAAPRSNRPATDEQRAEDVRRRAARLSDGWADLERRNERRGRG